MGTDKEVTEHIVWPEYFDVNLSRRLGRRVPRHLAVSKVAEDILLNACREVGIDCEVVRGRRYPRVWFRSYGWYLVVRSKTIKKNTIIRKLAEVMKRLTK